MLTGIQPLLQGRFWIQNDKTGSWFSAGNQVHYSCFICYHFDLHNMLSFHILPLICHQVNDIFTGLEPGHAIVPILGCNWNCRLKKWPRGQCPLQSPSKFREKSWKEEQMKRFSSVQILQAKTEHGKCILSHVRSKFIHKWHFSDTSVTLYWTRMSHAQPSMMKAPGNLQHVTLKLCSNNRKLFYFNAKPDWIRKMILIQLVVKQVLVHRIKLRMLWETDWKLRDWMCSWPLTLRGHLPKTLTFLRPLMFGLEPTEELVHVRLQVIKKWNVLKYKA